MANHLNSGGRKMIMAGNACHGKPPLRCALYLHFYAPPVCSSTPFLCYISLLCSLPLHKDCRTAKQEQSDDPCLSISHRIDISLMVADQTQADMFLALLSFREIDNIESTPNEDKIWPVRLLKHPGRRLPRGSAPAITEQDREFRIPTDYFREIAKSYVISDEHRPPEYAIA